MAQINKPNTHFNPVLYTGTGATNSVTSLDFQPDLIWSKSRTDVGGYGHFWQDSIRGVNKRLMSNSTAGENTLTNTLDSFDSNGFTMGADSTTEMNKSGSSYVAWNWKAGGTAVSNTAGSITSSVSANTTSGFSVVTWTGTGANATVGHGLGSVPKMIILKNRDSAENWIVGNTSLGWTKYLALNLTDSATTVSNIWQDTAPDSDKFSIGASGKVNGSTHGMVAYCFAEKKGFSKFGSYTGNGNATDGPFIYTGFKPAFVLIKASNATEAWTITDDARDTYNPATKILYPSASSAEGSNTGTDYLSNGFKLRTGDGAMNLNSSTNYIYMAFAENPLVGTNGIPATAR